MARVHRSQAFATESMQFPGLIRERDRQKKQKPRWKCVEESCIMPKKPAAGDWMLIAECIEKTGK